MKTISVSVSESEYEEFREEARRSHRSIAQLIREAMTYFREQRLAPRTRLEDLPVLAGHQMLGELPSRDVVYDEMFERA